MPGTTTVFTTRAAPSGNVAPPLQPPAMAEPPHRDAVLPRELHNQEHTACGPLNAFLPRLLCLFSQHLSRPRLLLAPSSRPGQEAPDLGPPGSAPSLVKPMGRLLGVRLQAVQSPEPEERSRLSVGAAQGGPRGAGQLLQLRWLRRSLSGKPSTAVAYLVTVLCPTLLAECSLGLT